MKRRHCKTCICELGEVRPIPRIRKRPRKGPMRDKAYRAWCREQACVISGLKSGDPIKFDNGSFSRYAIIDPAHSQNNGMRSKGPDSSCVPLERALHEEYDKDKDGFEQKYRVDMRALGRQSYQQYLRERANAQPKI